MLSPLWHEKQTQMDKKTGKYIESAVYAMYWVTGGIDHCHTGPFSQHYVACGMQYNGILRQVIDGVFNYSVFLSIRDIYKKIMVLSMPLYFFKVERVKKHEFKKKLTSK